MADDRELIEADAAAYRWLIEHFPTQITTLAWSVPDACAESCNALADPQQRARACMDIAVKQAPGKR